MSNYDPNDPRSVEQYKTATEMARQMVGSGLSGRADIDPGRWRPLSYPVYIDVPVAAGGQQSGSVTLNNEPFVLRWITHKIVGNTADPETSGLYQDGQYLVDMRDEQSTYQKDLIPADLLWGNVAANTPGAFALNLAYPIPFAGNKTLTFRVQNSVTRVLVPESETFKVCITLSGIADWGTYQKADRR